MEGGGGVWSLVVDGHVHLIPHWPSYSGVRKYSSPVCAILQAWERLHYKNRKVHLGWGQAVCSVVLTVGDLLPNYVHFAFSFPVGPGAQDFVFAATLLGFIWFAR